MIKNKKQTLFGTNEMIAFLIGIAMYIAWQLSN